MWTKYSHGMGNKNFGSKLPLVFLSAFLLFSPSLLWPEDQTKSQAQQTMPSAQYSKMTRDELLTQIADKDKLMLESANQLQKWITDYQTLSKTAEALKISLAESKQASAEQLASRDKLIKDQGYVIDDRTKERDRYRAAYEGLKAASSIEKLFYGLAGGGVGFAAGHFSK